ncbi:MAG: thiol:disulfide interchange protein DsbA/DsbL [Steroidobacteraceae bacterium]
MTRILSCVLAALLVLAACSTETPPATTEQAQAPEKSPAETIAEAPPAETRTQTDEPGSSDGESVDVATSATSPIAAAIAAATPAAPSGDLSRWKEGENFQTYPVAQPVSTPPGSVEIVEGFWYGCGHCYSLEPRLVAWERAKPDWIKVKRVPVIWNEVTREDARLFYTIESLGLLDKLHTEVYREIHAKGRPLTVIRGGRVDRAATEKAAREFLTSNGVTAEDFAKHYRTFSAENKLRQAENLSRRYRLDHTPMMVVHGKYLTDVEMAGGIEQLFQLVSDLAARERDAT